MRFRISRGHSRRVRHMHCTFVWHTFVWGGGQIAPGVYLEAALAGLDHVVAAAAAAGLSLVLSLADNWKYAGGVDQVRRVGRGQMGAACGVCGREREGVVAARSKTKEGCRGEAAGTVGTHVLSTGMSGMA